MPSVEQFKKAYKDKKAVKAKNQFSSDRQTVPGRKSSDLSGAQPSTRPTDSRTKSSPTKARRKRRLALEGMSLIDDNGIELKTAVDDPSEVPISVVEVEEMLTESKMDSRIEETKQTKRNKQTNGNSETASEKNDQEIGKGDQGPLGDTEPSEKFRFDFAGNDILRKRFPKTVALSEAVIHDWVNDGRFDQLPIENPLADFFAQKSLRQAKDFEQKFFQHPLVEKALVNAVTAGFKVQNAWVEAKKKLGR